MFISRKKYENMKHEKQEMEEQLRELKSQNKGLTNKVSGYEKREQEKKSGRVKGEWCEVCDNLVSMSKNILFGNEYNCACRPPCPNFRRSSAENEK